MFTQNELFFVEAIESHKKYPVYGCAAGADGQPMFLFYVNNEWMWAPAAQFKPTIKSYSKKF